MIAIQDLKLEIAEEVLISKLNLTVKQGEFWAIIGKNGTGKSTLLHTLAGFLNFKQGSIRVDGDEIKTMGNLKRAQNIAFLPQLLEASLNCTVEQSIAFGRYPWHKRKTAEEENSHAINSALDVLELNDIRLKSIQEISGGELRKVEIATLLAQNSSSFMLDEPLNHLDISMRYKLMQHLKSLCKNKLILMVTHDIQYVQEYCTHVMLLQSPKKVLIGTVDDIMTKENLNTVLGIPLNKQI